jgi:hypothetical protein
MFIYALVLAPGGGNCRLGRGGARTSVVMATIMAAVVLREPVSRGRATGAVLVAAGVVALALA